MYTIYGPRHLLQKQRQATQHENACFRISETCRKHATPCFRYVYVSINGNITNSNLQTKWIEAVKNKKTDIRVEEIDSLSLIPVFSNVNLQFYLRSLLLGGLISSRFGSPVQGMRTHKTAQNTFGGLSLGCTFRCCMWRGLYLWKRNSYALF